MGLRRALRHSNSSVFGLFQATSKDFYSLKNKWEFTDSGRHKKYESHLFTEADIRNMTSKYPFNYKGEHWIFRQTILKDPIVTR